MYGTKFAIGPKSQGSSLLGSPGPENMTGTGTVLQIIIIISTHMIPP